MPRISDTRRAANRAAIVDAARRCFARDGFHQTSMPDLVAEAGISAGAFYRYFDGKEELIREIAREAFAGIGQAVVGRMELLEAPSVADVVGVLTSTLAAGSVTVGDREVDLDEQARVAVQAWAEIARDEGLRAESGRGLAGLAGGIASALARGQRAGRVPADLDPADGARFVLALLPGMILQRTASGQDTVTAIGRAATALLDG
jgi:AcrR family transcriptional regulator